MKNLCKEILSAGGSVRPLLMPSNLTGGTGLMNPSIYNDDGKLVLNLRHTNYTLYHDEMNKLYASNWGVLAYLHPENDRHLRTFNYLCTLNPDLTIKDYKKVNTSKFDTGLDTEFIGLEDARLFRWNGKLYLCGVGRDTKQNGEGRMELSEIERYNDNVVEVGRSRIEPPGNADSYCEKNWVPVLDNPFHFVKWHNPTEIVKVFPEERRSETIFLSDKTHSLDFDIRGGSQVISHGDHYYTIAHAVRLWKTPLGQKEGQYRHVLVMWDKNWNMIKLSERFSFMDAEIEFCAGMTIHDDNLIITFGFQDNAAFLASVPVIKLNAIFYD